MKIICKYNNSLNLPDTIPTDFDYGLYLEKEYLVMGLLTFKKNNDIHYLIDENGSPSWFPFQIFEIKDNSLPKEWFVKINVNNEYVDYKNLMGFDELCNDEDFYDQLLDRDKEAMLIYFKRKMELEKELFNI